jgi:hypothetical protein
MYTKSSKQVLSPLADAVAALIVIISESEISGAPTPDLTQLSKAVDTQIKNLVVVAKKISSQPAADDTLRTAMPLACGEVADASSCLVAATAKLLGDPRSSYGRSNLLDGVKGILQGTTKILDVFDESEIVKILSATALLRTLLQKTLSLPVECSDHHEFLHVTKRMGQCIFHILQLATKRAKDTLSGLIEHELSNTIQALKEETFNYISSCKIMLSAPTATEAKQVYLNSHKTMEKLSYNLDTLVTCKDIEDYFRKVLWF